MAAAEKISFPVWWCWAAGLKENNYIGIDLRDSLLVDVKNRDFRPKSYDVFTKEGKGSIVGDKTVNQIGPYKGQTRQFMTIQGCTGPIQDPAGLHRTFVCGPL